MTMSGILMRTYRQDTCDSIIKHIGVTEEQFFAWNPAVGDAKKHTCDNLKIQYWVCIGVQHAASRVDKTTTTSAPTAPTFTSWLNSTTFGSGSTTAAQTSLLYTASSESLTSSEPGVTFITKTKSSVGTSDSTSMADAPKSTVSYTNPPTQWTTSTVYTTRVLTFYSCAPEMKTSDCLDGPHFTTEAILVSTTVCPVTEIGTGPQHTQLATFITDASTSLYPPGPNPTSSAASISSAPTVKHHIPTEATASTRPSAVVSDGLDCPAPVATPLPREDCMIGGCKRFYLVQEGDYCTKISRGAGISIEDFYE
ncbi:hypothetical protein NCS55_00425300 [Fusarium keratoplasticum]|nr:hypothetical protein NCS55_00425300 [Fusarium keratoplasticum]